MSIPSSAPVSVHTCLYLVRLRYNPKQSEHYELRVPTYAYSTTPLNTISNLVPPLILFSSCELRYRIIMLVIAYYGSMMNMGNLIEGDSLRQSGQKLAFSMGFFPTSGTTVRRWKKAHSLV
jgi:hypothetical protein